MKIAWVTLSCDMPDCTFEETFLRKQKPARDWFSGNVRLQGRLVETHICNGCVGNLLDPADDIAGELRRFALEDRFAPSEDVIRPFTVPVHQIPQEVAA